MAHSIKSSWSFQAYNATQRNKKNARTQTHTKSHTQSYLIAKKVLCHLLFRQSRNRNILSSSEEAEQRVQRRHFWITSQAKKNKKKKQFQILARIKFASMTSLHNWSNRCVTHTLTDTHLGCCQPDRNIAKYRSLIFIIWWVSVGEFWQSWDGNGCTPDLIACLGNTSHVQRSEQRT